LVLAPTCAIRLARAATIELVSVLTNMAIFKLAAKSQTNVVCAVAMIALALTARELWVVNPSMTAVACAMATAPASTVLALHMV